MAMAMAVRMAVIVVMVMAMLRRCSNTLRTSLDTSLLLQLVGAARVQTTRVHPSSLLACVR